MTGVITGFLLYTSRIVLWAPRNPAGGMEIVGWLDLDGGGVCVFGGEVEG